MTFEELLDGARDSIFRLETRQRYDAGEDDQMEAFRHGRPLPVPPARKAWLDFVRTFVASGRRICRVHIVEAPLSEYMRFELAAYVENAAAGEEINLVDINARPGLHDLRRDFWLIDEASAALLHYDDEDRYQDWELTSDRAMIDRLCHERDLALERATPLAELHREREHGSEVA